MVLPLLCCFQLIFKVLELKALMHNNLLSVKYILYSKIGFLVKNWSLM